MEWYQSNHVNAGNREAGDFVNSAVSTFCCFFSVAASFYTEQSQVRDVREGAGAAVGDHSRGPADSHAPPGKDRWCTGKE